MNGNSIYYEFWRDTVGLVKTGFRVLNNIQLTTGIDTVPTMTLTVPLDELPPAADWTVQQGGLVDLETNYAEYIIRVYFVEKGQLKYRFSGIVDKSTIDYAKYTMTFELSHIVARMRDWIMPANYIVKNMPVQEVIGGTQLNLGSPSTPVQTYDGSLRVDFTFEFDGERKIETTFSSTNKLSALDEICNNTEDLHWRVELGAESITNDNMVETAKITISDFSDKGKNCTISTVPVPDDECDSVDAIEYVTMLTEPTYEADYTNHYNRVVVFCGDVNADVCHLTLKPLWDIESYRNDMKFPVGMYDKEINTQGETKYEDDEDTDTCSNSTINNEKIYETGNAIVYADNDNREFYVTDIEGLARDGGVIKHSVLNFSDLYPIPQMEETDEDCNTIEYMINDEDRLEITKRAYARAVRKLKAQRPSDNYTFNCTALPAYISDGDKVTFAFTKKLIPSDIECDEEMKEVPVISVNERIYITKRIITFDSALNEYATVTLSDNLKYRDISAVEIKLAESVVTPYESNYDGSSSNSASTSTDVNRFPNSVLDFVKDLLGAAGSANKPSQDD